MWSNINWYQSMTKRRVPLRWTLENYPLFVNSNLSERVRLMKFVLNVLFFPHRTEVSPGPGTSCKMYLHPTDRLLREITEIILQNIMENTKSPPYIIISKLAWEIIDNNNNKISQSYGQYMYIQSKNINTKNCFLNNFYLQGK